MNERLKELIEQCTDRHFNEDGGFETFDKEKFAELIVRECAEIADEGYGSDHFGNGIAGYQLLKHFGVEE
jgi:hypothetical protein